MGSTKDKKDNDKDLPLVPEHVLRKRHDLDDLARKRAALEEIHGPRGKKQQKKVIGNTTITRKYVIKPETILAQARNKRNHLKRYKRVQKKGMQKRACNYKTTTSKDIVDEHGDIKTITYQNNSYGAKVVFVVRIRHTTATPKQIKDTLYQLGLRSIHDGVFVQYNDTNRKLLHLVEPYVVYGPPTEAAVKDLLERRGYARIITNNDDDNNNDKTPAIKTRSKKDIGERVPLSDNTIIENVLGDKYNILCIDDLVYEIMNPTNKHFNDVVTKFLWPFKLSDSKTQFERITLKLKDGKIYGDRGDAIHEYIQCVL